MHIYINMIPWRWSMSRTPRYLRNVANKMQNTQVERFYTWIGEGWMIKTHLFFCGRDDVMFLTSVLFIWFFNGDYFKTLEVLSSNRFRKMVVALDDKRATILKNDKTRKPIMICFHFQAMRLPVEQRNDGFKMPNISRSCKKYTPYTKDADIETQYKPIRNGRWICSEKAF